MLSSSTWGQILFAADDGEGPFSEARGSKESVPVASGAAGGEDGAVAGLHGGAGLGPAGDRPADIADGIFRKAVKLTVTILFPRRHDVQAENGSAHGGSEDQLDVQVINECHECVFIGRVVVDELNKYDFLLVKDGHEQGEQPSIPVPVGGDDVVVFGQIGDRKHLEYVVAQYDF